MGKVLPHSACSFEISSGSTPGLNFGPQALTDNPEQILLGPGDTAVSIRLPEPGTYLLLGRLQVAGNFNAGDILNYYLLDDEAEYEIGDVAESMIPIANYKHEFEITRLYSVSSPRKILWVVSNEMGTRGEVKGLRTYIKYIRLN